MGTNYYLKTKACEHCGLRDERETLHIGKASAGWAFHFRGYGSAIASAQDWRDEMAKPDREVVNEYGQVLSPVSFWALVKEHRNGASFARIALRRTDPVTLTKADRDYIERHPLDMLVSGEYAAGRPGNEWLDAEGNSFSASEFS